MTRKWLQFVNRIPLEGWWVIAPTLIIVALMLALTGTSSAARAAQPPRILLSTVLFQEQKPLCQSCHPKEYEAWKGTTHADATLDPVFQEQLGKSHNQAACLACHTTGFDTGSGKFLSEGVTCEACHGTYKDGHPAAATMQLPMKSETCRMCHQETFKQWEASQHANNGIECFDCHMAHTQGLRTGSEEKLCSACHADRQTAFAHATHGIEGVECATCHMAEPSKEVIAATMGQKPVSNHNFQVGSDVCAGCHKGTIHSAAPVSMETSSKTGGAVQSQAAQAQGVRTAELDREVTSLQQQLDSVRNVAVVSMGFSFAFGGFLGLLAGVLGASLWHKRGSA